MDEQRTRRFLADVDYDLLVPPHGIAYSSMTATEAKEDFKWFVAHIPDRMDYFTHRCANDMKINVNKLDCSSESLIIVWDWFMKTARMEDTPEEQLKIMREQALLFGESAIVKKVYTVATRFMMRDIAIYWGQCFLKASNKLYWDYVQKPKSEVRIHQPCIRGLIANRNNKEYPTYFAPIHMVEVQASGIYDGSITRTNLIDVFHSWTQYIPN